MMQSFLNLSLYLRILKCLTRIPCYCQASYADSQRSNKLNKVKQNKQRVGVNNVDSDFVVSNDD